MLKSPNHLLLTGILFFALTTMGQQNLLQNSLRPTIKEVLDNHPGYRAEHGIPIRGDRLAFPHFQKAMTDGAPQFIAQLEKAYPGATFAFMGRDTQAISDIVDAFYQSIGQKNRVVQIAMSKPTLDGLTNKEIETYLKNFGLDIDQIDSSKPFILVDTVSKGEVIDGALISGRQGRHLLQILIQAWVKRGKDPQKLLKKVNMIALRVSTFKATSVDNIKRYKNISEIELIQKENEALIKSRKNDFTKISADLVLPMIDDTQGVFNESGYDHYTGTWHDRFQTPIKNGKGLLPNPGQITDVNVRRSVLWLQHQIIEIVSSTDFRNRMIKAATDKGIEFSNLKAEQILISCKNTYK